MDYTVSNLTHNYSQDLSFTELALYKLKQELSHLRDYTFGCEYLKDPKNWLTPLDYERSEIKFAQKRLNESMDHLKNFNEYSKKEYEDYVACLIRISEPLPFERSYDHTVVENAMRVKDKLEQQSELFFSLCEDAYFLEASFKEMIDTIKYDIKQTQEEFDRHEASKTEPQIPTYEKYKEDLSNRLQREIKRDKDIISSARNRIRKSEEKNEQILHILDCIEKFKENS